MADPQQIVGFGLMGLGGLCWVVIGFVEARDRLRDRRMFKRHPKHRGEYVEKSEWKPPPKPPTFTIHFAPVSDVLTLPALLGNPGPPPPVIKLEDFHNGRPGEFGDSAFDRTDTAPLCPPVASGVIEGAIHERDEWEKAWQPIGTLATVE